MCQAPAGGEHRLGSCVGYPSRPGSSGLLENKAILLPCGVAQVADIEMRSIGVTKTRLALVKTAGGKGGGVKRTHLALAGRLERDHGAVAGRSGASIEGRFDVEIRQRDRLTGLPGQDITEVAMIFFEARNRGPAGTPSKTVPRTRCRQHRR